MAVNPRDPGDDNGGGGNKKKPPKKPPKEKTPPKKDDTKKRTPKYSKEQRKQFAENRAGRMNAARFGHSYANQGVGKAGMSLDKLRGAFGAFAQPTFTYKVVNGVLMKQAKSGTPAYKDSGDTWYAAPAYEQRAYDKQMQFRSNFPGIGEGQSDYLSMKGLQTRAYRGINQLDPTSGYYYKELPDGQRQWYDPNTGYEMPAGFAPQGYVPGAGGGDDGGDPFGGDGGYGGMGDPTSLQDLFNSLSAGGGSMNWSDLWDRIVGNSSYRTPGVPTNQYGGWDPFGGAPPVGYAGTVPTITQPAPTPAPQPRFLGRRDIPGLHTRTGAGTEDFRVRELPPPTPTPIPPPPPVRIPIPREDRFPWRHRRPIPQPQPQPQPKPYPNPGPLPPRPPNQFTGESELGGLRRKPRLGFESNSML